MRRCALLAVLTLCVAFEVPAFDRLVLISDIDDTLKASDIIGLTNTGLSDVRRKSIAIKSAASSRNPFTGLSLLYTAFACTGVEAQAQTGCQRYRAHNRGAGRMVFYVTGAPNKLVGFSMRFLLNSRFPLGPVLPREHSEASTLEHKVTSITEIIEHLPESIVILVGDNGEHDTEVFAEIEKIFQGRESEYQIHSFVHQVASPTDQEEELRGAPIGDDQIGFITAADLAARFLAEGWIDEDAATEVTEVVKSAITDPETRLGVIPGWINCRGFRALAPGMLDAVIAKIVEAR